LVCIRKKHVGKAQAIVVHDLVRRLLDSTRVSSRVDDDRVVILLQAKLANDEASHSNAVKACAEIQCLIGNLDPLQIEPTRRELKEELSKKETAVYYHKRKVKVQCLLWCATKS
jgi:hypothetical protein